jgi:hypothetical protein
MKIPENQKTQIIVLFCLLMAVIAFGAYRILGTKTQASPKATVSKQVSKSVDKSNPTENQYQKVDQQTVQVATAETQARDPFTPQVGPKDESTSEKTANSRSNLKIVPPTVVGPIPPITSIQPIEAPSSQTANEENEAESLPDLRLTGVIEGETNVAIFRLGDNIRYIVREGQFVDGRFLVESISRAGVKLRYRNKSFTIKPGGSLVCQNTSYEQPIR